MALIVVISTCLFGPLLEWREYLGGAGEHESFIGPILFVCRALSGFLLCHHALHGQPSQLNLTGVRNNVFTQP